MAQATVAATVTGLQGRPLVATAPIANQALVWNGTNWAPAGPFVPLSGGSVTGNLAVTGSVNALTFQTSGNAGTFLNGAGTNVVTGRAFVTKGIFSSPFNTSSTSFVMAGANLLITPMVSGIVIFSASAQISNNANSGGASIGLRFGTGAAPTQGQAETGNQIPGYGMGMQNSTNNLTQGTWAPWCQSGIAWNMTIGTQYWFDMMMASTVSGGTSQLQWCSVTAMEV